MTDTFIIGVAAFFVGWLANAAISRLYISGKLIMLATIAERKSLTMIGRSHEHYHQSLHMLKTAGETTDRGNEIIRVINSLEFSHKQWQKSAVQAIYEAHPFKQGVKWYDWNTAMQTLEKKQ
jgi:uncharacterized protein Yka (UPF0111/DUF47 family)